MKGQENYNQLEMFSETNAAGRQKNNSGNIFAGCLRSHEKVVILIISFILIGSISFSLGVEQGKKMAAFQTKDMRIETAGTKPQTEPILKQKDILKNKTDDENKSRLAGLPQPLPAQGNKERFSEKSPEKMARYTIQLASYKKSSAAQNEAQKLKNKGHSPLILTKGNYIILCVGNFADKEIAETKLSDLKKKYHDGIIRRL